MTFWGVDGERQLPRRERGRVAFGQQRDPDPLGQV